SPARPGPARSACGGRRSRPRSRSAPWRAGCSPSRSAGGPPSPLDAAVALARLPVAVRHLAESRDPDAERVDWRGTATLSLGLFCGVFALTRGDVLGWGSGVIVATAAAAAVLLAAFVAGGGAQGDAI